MKDLDKISEEIKEAQKSLNGISDGQMNAEAHHARVRNMLSITEQELKFHELDKADTASKKLVEIVETLGTTAEILKKATTKAEQAAIIQEKHTQDMISWTKVMAGATIAVAVATIIYTITSFLQWDILSKQLESERGMVSITGCSLKPMQVGQPLEVDLLAVNVGRTFAFDSKQSSDLKIYSDSFNVHELESFIKAQKPSGADISPGSKLGIPLRTDFKLTEQQIDLINSGKVRITVGGEINYRDIFGKAHLTQYCNTYDSASNSFILCGEYNTSN